MTDFLRFAPTVCAVEEDYEILVATKEKGMVLLEIGDGVYHDMRGGVCRCETDYFKIRVPQAVLDAKKEYTVVFRASQGKEAYWTTFAPHKTARYFFRPIEKKENVNIYHVADVHYRFEMAKKTASFFGKDTDLFVINGDIGEVETEENYMEVLRFLGEIGEGRIPMVFSRGNHDTRGRLAERFTDYFPAPNGNTYYTFKVGPLRGVVLDVGEDKPDKVRPYDNTEDVPEKYRGINRFHEYRRSEARFLVGLAERGEKFDIAVSHICPNTNLVYPDDLSPSGESVYAEWGASLERMGVRLMLCGHVHKAYLIERNDPQSTVPHSYPIAVASALTENDLIGGAVTYSPAQAEIRFTNSAHETVERHEIPLV